MTEPPAAGLASCLGGETVGINESDARIIRSRRTRRPA